MPTKTKKVPKKGQKCKMCKNAKSAIYQNWPMLIPHPSRTQQIAQKPQQKTIVCKEKSGWMKIHQKAQKCNLFKKSWVKYFWTKTFPKRYDTCRGLFFTLASPQGQGDMVRWPYGQIWPNMAKWCLCINIQSNNTIIWGENISTFKTYSITSPNPIYKKIEWKHSHNFHLRSKES